MGIQIEFNPDLALREYGTPDREESECLPKTLIKGETYNFLKKGQRIFWLTDNEYWNKGEMPLVITKGNQILSKPIASIKIIEVTHFLFEREPYTKGKYKVIEVFDPYDKEIKFESYKRINKK
ncbi:hypothetical protein HOD75_03470 [archaeon]|jgi:hypothetical protein|nr:hypothetical protein [archaeon]MBT4241933.1 hypothetical protein [archaeon]MBT4418480.1 hypothetical protein [archaeon]